MTIWRWQDWVWRVTALFGASALLSVCSVLVLFLLVAPIRQGPQEADWTNWHSWLLLRISLPLAVVWLTMLRWRHGAWLWGGVWGIVGLCGVGLMMGWALPGRNGAGEDLLVLLVLISATASSQIWVAQQAWSTSTRCCRAEADGRVHGSSLWGPASLTWQLLAGVGGLIAIACTAWWIWPLCHSGLGHTYCILPGGGLAQQLVSANMGLDGIALPLVVLLLWRGLIIDGSGWLFWLLLWALCLPGAVAMLAGALLRWEALAVDFPFTLQDMENVTGATATTAAFAMLAITQVWVALKARQMRSRQAASEVRRLD